MIGFILISLKVVSIAVLFLASSRRSATRLRRRVIGTRFSLREPRAGAGVSLAAGAEAGAVAGFASLAFARCCSTSTGQTTAHTAAFNGVGIKRMFCNQAADRRAEGVAALFFQRSSVACRRSRFFIGAFLSAWLTRAVTRTNARQNLTGNHRCAFVFDDAVQNTGFARRHFQNHFIGFDFYQYIVTLNTVARLFVPGGNRRIRNGFRKVRDQNIYATHYQSFLCSIWLTDTNAVI